VAQRPAKQWWSGFRLRDINCMRLRTRRDLGNANQRVPTGTIVTVRSGHFWNDLHIEAEPCPRCGVAVRMSRVSRDELRAL
jgi:hypothetical protein